MAPAEPLDMVLDGWGTQATGPRNTPGGAKRPIDAEPLEAGAGVMSSHGTLYASRGATHTSTETRRSARFVLDVECTIGAITRLDSANHMRHIRLATVMTNATRLAAQQQDHHGSTIQRAILSRGIGASATPHFW